MLSVTRAIAQRRDERDGGGAGGGPSGSEVRLSSVVSTFLVSFGVVSAAIVAVVYVVLNGPDQPATIRRQPSRAKPRRTRREVAPAAEAVVSAQPPRAVTLPVAATPAFAGPDSDVMRLRVLPARRTTLWVRVRSGVVLVVLVAVLGALLALVIGALALGLALLVSSAAG
jgi:hypothetical protein